MAKKKSVIKRGIFLTRNPKGIVVSIHSANGNKLAAMSGYNNARNARKGISALHEAIEGSSGPIMGSNVRRADDYIVTDLTKPVKKTAKPTKK